MADLTPLDEKLAEVLGLAQAAQRTTQKIIKLTEDDQLRSELEQMKEEAAQTEERCHAIASEREGRKTAIEEKARETRREAEEMADTYLGDDADALDGFEFLLMAEAGELGHVEIVREINQQVGDQKVQELVEFALPIQERHFQRARSGALTLAREEAQHA